MRSRPSRNGSGAGLRSVQLLEQDGGYRAANINGLASKWREPYRLMLSIPWPGFLLLIALAYLATNLTFALLFLLDPAGIGGLPPGQVAGFSEAFFFSVQTLGSIGYGVLHPVSPAINLLVTLEAFVSIVFIAVTTGLVFARFSRSRAQIRFSEVATIEPWNGTPCLTFRMANVNYNSIVDGHLHVFLALDEITAEGKTMRRLHPLNLVRNHSTLFLVMWTVMHPIDGSSPLHGLEASELIARHGEILVSFQGVDETVRSPIYARWTYGGSRLRFEENFVDIVQEDDQGRRRLDFSHFNLTQARNGPAHATRL